MLDPKVHQRRQQFNNMVFCDKNAKLLRNERYQVELRQKKNKQTLDARRKMKMMKDYET
jgi:hypothetical protein